MVWGSKDGKTTWLKTRPIVRKPTSRPVCTERLILMTKDKLERWKSPTRCIRNGTNIFPGTKEATISDIVTDWDTRGPFEWVKKELEDCQLAVGGNAKQPTSGEVNLLSSRISGTNRTEETGAMTCQLRPEDETASRSTFTGPLICYDPDKDPRKKHPAGKSTGPKQRYPVQR